MKTVICESPTVWDAYVASSPGASNYHRWGWRSVIQQTFEHNVYYLLAIEDGATKGALPLVHMKSRLFGNFLASMPFFSYGGFLADSMEARDSLLVEAVRLAKELHVSDVELRQGPAEELPGWHDSTAKVTMQVRVPVDLGRLWENLSSGMRNKIRKAKKNLRVEFGGAESVKSFYQIFSINMRNLGTPVYPQKWFENIFKEFPKEVRIVTLRDKSRAVASGIVTLFRNALELPWSATLPESHKMYSAVLMYWALLEWAITHGYQSVDFGRCTRGGGVYEFKRHWNCQEVDLHWFYWLPQGACAPNRRPDNPNYRLAIGLWKRLPLAVANLLGPRIVRSIP